MGIVDIAALVTLSANGALLFDKEMGAGAAREALASDGPRRGDPSLRNRQRSGAGFEDAFAVRYWRPGKK